MPKDLLRRHLPTPASLRELQALRPVRKWLKDPEIWHLNRRSVSGAAFIGFFCAFLPIPFQMLVAAPLAILFRCNLPLAVALVWVTNPVTIGPIFLFCYQLGSWLLNSTQSVSQFELDWAWLAQNISDIAYPLVFGSLVCGWVAGVSGFVLIRVLWRLHVLRRWRERMERRRARRARRRQQVQTGKPQP